ncbi:MAG: hydrogenase iron-sulfur subunit [archaeon]|nr:hydrogenase iron-sulfur subunit [archaeon]
MAKEEVRIGVFVCHCGTNIGGTVDVPSEIEYVKGLPGVVYAERNLYTCSDEGVSAIKNAIKEYGLNRIVVAACTPRTHEPLFRSACQEAGLNPYLFDFVNIRDQCSWVHMREPEKATEKAKDLIRMGVARAARLEPLEYINIGVENTTMVIGAGISGMTAALSIANRGFEVYLVEKEAEIGGMLRKINKLYPGNVDAHASLEPTIEKVQEHPRIKLFTSSRVKRVDGYVGNFEVTVVQNGNGEERKHSFKVGTIIVATGAEVLKPDGLYGYGEYEEVITQMELEERLKENNLGEKRDVVMIQCVGSRGQRVAYCSRICCAVAIKNAILLKEKNPEANIHLLHNGIHVYGVEYEKLYRKAMQTGIRFDRYSPENLPEVVKEDGGLKVKFFSELVRDEREYNADLVVLSTPLVQHPDASELSKLLKVPLGLDRFFFEAHVKLRPIDFSTDGIFLCGTAHSPKFVPESVAEAYGTASRASTILTKSEVETEGIVSDISQSICKGCGLCAEVCEYGALTINRYGPGEFGAEVNRALCKGCGTCAAACPYQAITMRHFRDEQILAQIKSAYVPEEERIEIRPRILAFSCNWCSYAGADMAGVSRFQYPPNAKLIRVMCAGRIDPWMMVEPFFHNVDGVLVTGCHIGDCHYVVGNYHAEMRVKFMKKLLEFAGIDPGRLRLGWISAAEGQKFKELIESSVKEINELGPFELEKHYDALLTVKEGVNNPKLRWIVGKVAEIARYVKLEDKDIDAFFEEIVKSEIMERKVTSMLESGEHTLEGISETLSIPVQDVLKYVAPLMDRGTVQISRMEGKKPFFISGRVW